jgi:hypothetical protein
LKTKKVSQVPLKASFFYRLGFFFAFKWNLGQKNFKKNQSSTLEVPLRAKKAKIVELDQKFPLLKKIEKRRVELEKKKSDGTLKQDFFCLLTFPSRLLGMKNGIKTNGKE